MVNCVIRDRSNFFHLYVFAKRKAATTTLIEVTHHIHGWILYVSLSLVATNMCIWNIKINVCVYGLVQDCSISIANTLKILQSCTEPWVCFSWISGHASGTGTCNNFISFVIWCQPITYTCTIHTTWWRHQMKTFSAWLAICAGNSPVPGEFPTQRPVTRSFDVYFDLRPNNRWSKQSLGWWFETLSPPLWRHRNDIC